MVIVTCYSSFYTLILRNVVNSSYNVAVIVSVARPDAYNEMLLVKDFLNGANIFAFFCEVGGTVVTHAVAAIASFSIMCDITSLLVL